MTIHVLDISHHQSKRNPDGSYTVVADMQAAKAAGAAGVIVRSCYGHRPDTTAPEHNRRADAAGLPRAAYWYLLSRHDPVRQATTAYIQLGQRPGVRLFADLEENADSDGAEPVFPRYSEDHWQHVNRALVTADNLTGLLTSVYSRQTWMDRWFTLEQQRRWADEGRLGWWAHYSPPGPDVPWVPAGWKGQPVPWVLWQDRIGPWPGFPGDVDHNVVRLGLALSVIFGADAVLPPPPPDNAPIAQAISMISETISSLQGIS